MKPSEKRQKQCVFLMVLSLVPEYGSCANICWDGLLENVGVFVAFRILETKKEGNT
jgi:hypothetical protein